MWSPDTQRCEAFFCSRTRKSSGSCDVPPKSCDSGYDQIRRFLGKQPLHRVARHNAASRWPRLLLAIAAFPLGWQIHASLAECSQPNGKGPNVTQEQTSDRSNEKAVPFHAYGASAATQQVVAVHFSDQDGKLTGQIVQHEDVGFEAAPVVWNSQRRLLYVASLRAEQLAQNRLTVFSVGADGRISRLQELERQHGSAYLSLDRSGRFLLSASYFEGRVDVYRLDERGIPNQLAHTQYEGRDKAHSILTTPDNRFAYVPYVSDQNALFQYSFDENSGKLLPLDPPRAEVAAGVGPRHVAYHPTKPFIFFSNEQQLGASSYRIRDGGQLELVQVCQAEQVEPDSGLAASDIAITANGRFLYVALRDFEKGSQNAVHGYEVQENGELAHLGATETDAIPWGLQRSPDGRYLLVTATDGATLTAFEVDPRGNLLKENSISWGQMIRDIVVD